MRAHVRGLAFAAALSCALAASAQELPEPSPEPTGSRWYGWQIMLADAASYGVAGTVAALSLGVTAGLVVDWAVLSWDSAPRRSRLAVVPLVGKQNGTAIAIAF